MKITAKLLLGASLFAAATAASAGQFITVEVRGRVESVSDSGNVLGGQVTPGQLVTGDYKYDTGAADDVPDPAFGYYPQPNASMKLVAGSLVFESDAISGDRAVSVERSSAPGSSTGFIQVMSQANKPLPNGATVQQIGFYFEDSTGHEPATDALPTSAPNLQTFDFHKAHLYGVLNGQSYSVSIDIELTYSEGMQSDLVVSPGKSTFVAGQRFDVALILPAGSQILRAASRLNGQPLPMSLPGGCHVAPPNTQNRPTILCPDAQWHLPQVEGKQLVEWEVELIDGTILTNPVEWTFIQ